MFLDGVMQLLRTVRVMLHCASGHNIFLTAAAGCKVQVTGAVAACRAAGCIDTTQIHDNRLGRRTEQQEGEQQRSGKQKPYLHTNLTH